MSEFDLEKVQLAVKVALAGGDAQPALILVSQKCQELKAAVDGGPVMKVSPERYQTADKLMKWSHQLALSLAERKNDHLEEIAWQLRASPILTMHGHHRHLVGPAMIDWANCNKRIGNQEKADMLYQAVINDFRGLLDVQPSGATDWFTALESLKKALQNHTGDHTEDLRRVKERLSQWEQAAS